jgi:hypothetical protein
MNPIYSLVVATLMQGTAPPATVGPTVLGQELGKPITLPECPHKRWPDGRMSPDLYELYPNIICHTPPIQLRDAPWRRADLYLPIDKIPLIMRGHMGDLIVIDDKLEGIRFETLGYGNAEAIISEVSAKFGKPVSIAKISPTIAGISVPARLVTWKSQGLVIEYETIGGDVANGKITFMTQTYFKAAEQHRLQQAGARTEL